jgi:uncharacterized protein
MTSVFPAQRPVPLTEQGPEKVPWNKPQIGMLPGERLHLQHGPIDLVIKAEGTADEIARAYQAAAERFDTALGELTAELQSLRKPLRKAMPVFRSSIAKRMAATCWPHRAIFITPMAAVAGAVADEILGVMLAASPALRTAFVNNGGDIAVHVAKGQVLKIGMVADLMKAMPDGVIAVSPDSRIGGIATSGWRGRSFSLGIADAVTVLARCAAEADAAATVIANAVDADDPAIQRALAHSIDPDSDLGDLPVTTDVGRLATSQIDAALDKGGQVAARLIKADHILGAFLGLQGEGRIFSQ